MNKKFTFMVAALLAAGSVFAAPTQVDDFAKASEGYYHIKIGDKFIGSTVTSSTSSISYVVADNVDTKTANYTWKVSINSKKEVTLVNKATGCVLAVNETEKALVANKVEYTNGAKLDKTFDLVGDKGSYELQSLEKELILSGSEFKLSTPETNERVSLWSVDDATVLVSTLQNIGTGIVVDFEGSIDGENIFNNVSVVTLAGFGDEQFLLQVGAAKETAYTSMESDEFKKAEFIVLTSRLKDAAGDATKGYGYTYAKVKGEKLLAAGTTDDALIESGKYPVENAVFSAISNVNKADKYAFKQAVVYTVNGKNWSKVSASTSEPIFIGYDDCGKPNGTDYLATSKEAVWATVSGGSAVDVKSLVKGQWVVNILASEDKESAEMVSVVYSTQEQLTVVKVSESSTETKKHKDAIYAQWIVSADKDGNTVSFFNRETGATIEKVTLFKTPKANVYSVSGYGDLNGKYIELRTIENTTQFDGYLNLDKEGLDSEYTLSVKADDKFADYEVPVLAKKSKLEKSENKDATNVFTFKLAQTKDDDSKLDTIFVNEVTYNFYKNGALTTAKDTLKAISYSFTGLKNASRLDDNDKDNNVVTKTFGLKYDKDGEGAGEFVFRKVGSKYQIVIADNDVYNSAFVGSTFVTTGTVAANQLFTLNPVAVAPSYDVPESHIALEINGAYLGSKADGNAIITNDTLMLKSTAVDAAFSFYAFSADKEEAKTPSYYLSSNGKMMNDAKAEVDAINKELEGLSEVFDAEKIKELKAKLATYHKDGDTNKARLVKFQQAKYVDAEHIALAKDTVKGDALKSYKFNVLDVDGQAVLKNASAGYVQVLNDAVVFTSDFANAAKFDVVAAEAPTSNEGVSATEVKVVANNGSINVKNAAGKNVVVSTILGQVVANEVLTSDNATINVPAGIVVVAVEGESFKVNVK
ncbi:MAG: DUF6383 domain-containing protein [Parabacteroides sp.]|nr:DUF6383 domain-containing protein [Parabacteroides sp.]